MARYPQIEALLARAENAMHSRGYSRRTRDAYLAWIRRFLHFHRSPHPARLGKAQAEQYLEFLAARRRLAAKTRNQAASAIAFLYREVLGSDAMAEVARPRNRKAVPVVLSRQEVARLLGELRGKYWLIGALLYGTGMRLNECLGLRVKDLDFDLGQIAVRDGKGGSHRLVPLPDHLAPPLERQVARVRQLMHRDRRHRTAWAPLPGAMHRKSPHAGHTLDWQYLFPASRVSEDTATGRRGRSHLHPSAVQKQVKQAVGAAGIHKPASCHSLRHSFATQMLRDGCDIRVLQKLMGHADVRTTMIYLHATDRIGVGLRTPIDRLIDLSRPGPITPQDATHDDPL